MHVICDITVLPRLTEGLLHLRAAEVQGPPGANIDHNGMTYNILDILLCIYIYIYTLYYTIPYCTILYYTIPYHTIP